jgi:CMP-N,N'-diacetyllegionaminic acid synthase
MNVVALIPARSGSKGVIDKNIKLLNGKPLISHAIDAGKNSEFINDVFISTDSQDYADLAIRSGAKAPFLRPEEISEDSSTDLECFQHFINFFNENKIKLPDFIVHLRATTPIRDTKIIDNAIVFFKEYHKTFSSLRSVHEMPESAFKYCTIEDKKLKSIGNQSFSMDSSNNARQTFPKTYIPNGYVDIISVRYLLENMLLHGDRVYPFITPVSYEIDTVDDFKLISKIYSESEQ